MAAKSLRDLNQKYRGKPKKYAEGGRARRPAAAPVPRPSDEDYLSILADRAVGAGEPVAELRSSEGRGFAPTPFQGEGFQRMSAMLRGEVEPTPGEQMGLNIVRGFTEGPASIRAYHGSPHRFERFDISKIGTGEGATAYGRGLYFAGNEGVARTYRDQSVGRRLIGGENPNFSRFDHYASSMDQMYGSRAKAIKAIKENAENGFGVDVAADAIRLLRSKQKLPEISYSPGHMYEVRLRTTPEELVNWDAPLVRQPERAVPFLEDVLRAPRTGSARVLEREMKPIGEAIDLRTPEIAAQLREAGIPGLRYLDAGSRTGRQNTRNYVMFGDDLIDITRRYAEGGLAELDQKYAEGGMVREPAAAYDPDEIDRIVQEFAEGGEVEAPAFDLRNPYESELEFFQKNPNVSGMATEDNRVILNPYSNLSGAEQNAVILNERARLAIRNNLVPPPDFDLTPEQIEAFSQIQNGRPYGNMRQIRETIAARILSGDPSALNPTADQMHYAQQLREALKGYARGGEVEAPAKTYIGGQEHKLAYITDREAALLKARGGSGRMTKHGIRAYNDANSDNANSNSEAAAQDAAGGNQGQGAGPTGAGAGGGPPGNDPGPTGEGQSEVNTPGMAPGISTAPTAVGPIGPEDEANAAAAKGAIANAPMGFEGYGIMDAIDAYNSGRMGLAQAIGYGIASVAAPPGFSVGFNVDPQTQTQTPAMSVSVPGVIGGLMGLATGVPGAGMIGGFIGNEIGKELGLDPTVMSYEPGVFNAPEPTPAYGAAGYGMDYGQGYAHGGLAKLHQKYAEGGEVEGNGGVERYDPREIDALASEFMAESNPADLMQRARLMMRGMNVGMPTNVGAVDLPENYQRYPRNENVSSFTSLREMPIEDDRFERALRTINTGINATLDQERGIRLGAGLQGIQNAGDQGVRGARDQGMSGYGANLSAGYGPVSLHGGYQSQVQAYSGAKPQDVYIYGGNLNIPLDDEGAKALLGAQVMSGRRGSAGAGNTSTLITGGLERPFLGGTLGVDVSVDPTLRNKEILFGYRRAF